MTVKFRKAVLKLSHGGIAGHTGVWKAYDRVRRRSGKPNQKVPVSPLQPIPAVSTSFQ